VGFLVDELALGQDFFSDFSRHCHSINASHSSFLKLQTDKPLGLSNSSDIHPEIAKHNDRKIYRSCFFMIQSLNICTKVPELLQSSKRITVWIITFLAVSSMSTAEP
jgi:hypothetical protein